MPIYEYVCAKCMGKVEVLASVTEKEKGLKPVCPKCGSKKLIRVFGAFAVRSAGGSSSGPGCPPGAGPSCCG